MQEIEPRESSCRSGPRRPAGLAYDRNRMVTDWRVLGPLTRTYEEVERAAEPGAVSVRDGGSVVG